MGEPKFSRFETASDPLRKKEAPVPAKKEKSIRLTFELGSGKHVHAGYIVNYETLVKKAKAKVEKETKNGTGGLPDLHDSCEEELERIASIYAQKYGRDSRYHSYTDLGAGYDDEDSFIDNTEANEEGIPEELDTKRGGFYINCGTLELTNRR